MALNCNIRQSGDITILDLSGRLTLGEEVAFGPGSGLVLGECIRDLIKKGHKQFVLNLAGINYVDSSGAGQLVSAMTSARNHGGEVKLLKPNERVTELMKTTKLDTLFDVKMDEAACIQAFSKSAGAAR